MAEQGEVFLVGAGPGDPGLLTLRARDLIADCDVLVYDYLVNEAVLAWTRADCEHIFVGKRPHFHALPQNEICDLLVKLAGQGRRVVRLKGGDPFVFGRGGEELAALREKKIPCQVVPGVTAALAAAAYTGLPLTHRECSSAVSFLTGHENPDKHEMRVDFRRFAGVGGTLCIYMGVGQCERIVQQLLEGGMDPETPVQVVEWATTARQRVLQSRLSDLPKDLLAEAIQSPAVIFVGPTAEHAYNWFDDRPLSGKRIVVTRAAGGQPSRMASAFAAQGAEVVEMPLIAIHRGAETDRLTEVFAELGSYDWIVFTSANGVQGFFHHFFEKWNDIRHFGGLRIACVGRATAEAVAAMHLQCDLVPERFDGDALADALVEEDIENRRILVITGNRNREVLPERLEAAGAIVDTLPVYRTELVDLAESDAAATFRQRGADALVFASSSAVEAVCSQAEAFKLSGDAVRPAFVSFGPITSKTLREKGLPVDIEAEEATVESVVMATIKHFSKGRVD